MRVPRIIVIAASLTALASLARAQTARTVVNLPRGELASIPLSDAILVGNTLYLSGRGGIDFKTMKAPADPKDEVKLLMEDVKAVLERAGMTMNNLVSVTIYCSDLSLYSAFNSVYQSYFTKDFPARAFVGSGPLLFGLHFELQGIAIK
jgi:2-iminobutanoate/2-iminopropanoate deaminase